MFSGFTATPGELSLVNQIFTLHDTQKLGILTGDVAVRAFGGANLAPTTLGEIWNIADEDNNGWLSRKGVAIALRLIAWAQKGEQPVAGLVTKPAPLATIDGLTPLAPQSTGMSGGMTPVGANHTPGMPPLTPQDKAKFQNLFYKTGPANGLISGEQARDVFVKSQLPNDILLQIWNLADTKDRGNLDVTDFVIGMYLIQGVMKKTIPTVPSTLPPTLYQQAGGIAPQSTSIAAQMTGGSGTRSPVQNNFNQNRSYIQPQMTGQSTGALNSTFAPRPGPSLPPRPPVTSSPFVSQPSSNWDITPVEKANSDRIFESLDTQHRNYIEGEVAVPFMLESKLSEEILAQIWDLADINNDGRLTRDGFAVAMYLIQKKLAGQEVPATLPPSLVPPSMRGASAGASIFGARPAPAAPEPPKDLFSFDDEPTPTAAPTLSPTHTGAFSAQATGQSNMFSPQNTQSTGATSPAQTRSPPPLSQDPFGTTPFGPTSSSSKDFLSDDDDNANAQQLHDKSAEIGNVQNQFQSTNRSLETTKADRQTIEQRVAEQASQLSSLETQLSSAKAAYETETKLLSALRERSSTQSADIQKTREDLIHSESDLSAVRVEKAEVEQALLRDKEEARELHRKMIEAGQQADALKAEVEKIKREAKQQKGMLAVARKQLLAKETERSKAQAAVDAAQAELDIATQERETAEAELASDQPAATPTALLNERVDSQDSLSFAAAQPLPVTPDLGSPSIASAKSNNPFERLQQGSTPRSGSPFLPFAGSVASSPPPATNGSVATATADDPFGFSQALADNEPTTSTEPTTLAYADDASETPTPGGASVTVVSIPEATEEDLATVASPTSAGDTDDFTTPPTTATGLPDSANKRNTMDISSKFPAISETGPQLIMPGSMPTDNGIDQTDLNTPLKDLDVEESDSDSDSEDEVPLAKIADEKRASLAAENAKKETAALTGPSESNTTSTFDDIFGPDSTSALANDKTEETKPAQELVDAFGVSVQKEASPFTSTAATSQEARPADVDAFDQAMGTIVPAPAAANDSFTFESSFDDTFDFGKEAPFTPEPSHGATNDVSPAPAQGLSASKDDGFDSLFTSPTRGEVNTAPTFPPVSTASPAAALSSEPTPTGTNGAAKPAGKDMSFDEVFSESGFGASPSLDLNGTQQTQSGQDAFPVASPNSPPREPASPTTRPESPTVARSRSPPPRVGSPKLARPSTSSSERAAERPSQPAPRHSKLSIRLPFGKKKKQQQQQQQAAPPLPLPSSQLLTPPREESVTPAAADDADAVKQLTAMGFSRTQAVTALEKSAYDVPRALNSLLSQAQ